jgi:hypothetical protein
MIAIFCVVLGFNTLDQMIWAFRFDSFWLQVNYWDMGAFILPQWWTYYFCGIAPLMSGSILIGYLIENLRAR